MGIFNRKNGEHDRSQFEFEDSFAKPEAGKTGAPVPPRSTVPETRQQTTPQPRSPGPPHNPAQKTRSNQQPEPSQTAKARDTAMKPNVKEEASVSPPKNNPVMSYSIEDAIVLMRELPSDQREMVVSIVQKTLSSANIDVGDIIRDANNKLRKLGTRKELLTAEIADLQKGISQREEEITTITKDVEETQTVKDSFEAKINPKKAIEKKSYGIPYD